MDWLNTLHEIIGSDDGSLTWWQMTTRAGLIFFVGLALIRLFGQRALGRQTVLDVILAIVIGSNLSRAATGNAPFVPTITATTGLVLLYWTLDQLAARWHLASWLVKGGVVQLVRDGKMDRKTMQHRHQ